MDAPFEPQASVERGATGRREEREGKSENRQEATIDCEKLTALDPLENERERQNAVTQFPLCTAINTEFTVKRHRRRNDSPFPFIIRDTHRQAII